MTAMQTAVRGANRLLFSRRETALLLTLSERSIDYLIANGSLASVRKGRRRLISRDALECFAGIDIRKRMAA